MAEQRCECTPTTVCFVASMEYLRLCDAIDHHDQAAAGRWADQFRQHRERQGLPVWAPEIVAGNQGEQEARRVLGMEQVQS